MAKRNSTLTDQAIAARTFEDYRNGRDLEPELTAAYFTGTALCDECQLDRARVLIDKRKLCLWCATHGQGVDADDESPSSRRAAEHYRDVSVDPDTEARWA